MPLLYPPARLAARLLGRLVRLEVSGLDNLPAGGCVVVCGHLSYLDPLLLVAALPRSVRFMGTYSHFGLPVGHLYPLVGAFPVRRGQGDLGAVARAASLARAGELVAIFPEGTRRHKGASWKRLLRLSQHQPRPRRGAARIAIAAQVPLVPVGLQGTDRLHRGRFRVQVGEPLEPQAVPNLGPASLAAEAWRRVRALECPADPKPDFS